VINELKQQARTRHVRSEITERLDRIEHALTDRQPQDDQKTA
jgi:hypothetical protein